MTEAHWILTKDAEVAWLDFDQTGSSANVLSRATLLELDERLREASAMNPRGLVIASKKKSGFIAGADIKEFVDLKTPAEAYELIRAGQKILDRLESLPFPTVAIIQGFALGGGFELALACSYRVGIDDGRLSLGLPEVKLGIHPGFGGTVRAVRIAGVRAAMQLMLTGKPLDARRALEQGFLDRLSSAQDARTTALDLIKDRPPKKSAGLTKRALGWPVVRALVASQIEAGVRAKARREHYPAPFAVVDLWRREPARG